MSYEFRLQEGYRDMQVVLDNVCVEPTGTIIMDRDRILKVSAQRSR